MSRVCSCVYEATFTPLDGRCYYTQYVTTPYMPYCLFTADCTQTSDQTPNKHETSSQCLLLVHRLRRWPNIKQTLGLVFAGQLDKLNKLVGGPLLVGG